MKAAQILYFFLSFTISSCHTSKTESDKEIIKQLFENYKNNTLKEDYGAVYDLIYPDVLKDFTKQEKIEYIKSGMHNPNYDVIIKEIISDSLYKVEKYGSNKYSLIRAMSKASFYLKHMPHDSLEYINQFNSMCNRTKEQLGNKNVNCNPQNGTIDIIQKANTYFIFDTKYKKWFMLGDDDSDAVEKFIPIEIRRKFGIN